MEKQETKGRARIISLFDVGTFVEMGAYVRRRSGAEKEAYDAVLCGYGAVNGQLAFAFVQDSDKNHGALDAVGADKIERLYAQAIRNGAPVIGVFDSAGAVVFDGAPALSAYGRVMRCVENASGIIPQIAYVTGVCSGMAAVIAAMFDVTVTVDGVSELYVHAPSVVGKSTGTAAYAKENGLSAVNAESEEAANAAVRTLIELLPRNNKDASAEEPTDDINRAVELSGAASLAGVLADQERVMPLYAYAEEVDTSIARLGGVSVGIVTVKGKLTAKGARKAARLVSLCDSFSMPVITLVDSEGVDTVADPEQASAFGRLASAYISATCPKVTVTVGKAYGAAFTLLGSRALGADLALALPEAVISVMDPASAVAFVWNDKVTHDKSRAEVEAEWKETYGSAVAAAESGDIDDIVPAAELRARLISAVYMLSECAEGTPERKHGNLPL